MSEKEVRLIDANACPCNECRRQWCELPHLCTNFGLWLKRTIDPESLRAHGMWDWKHRHKGGFHKYTGVDKYGETHTIIVDERFECDEPYCPECGKWNESIYLNYCPNCGAKMEG